MISIKHLRYFAALAQHRHFGRAADACAISQPALSLQIKDLEELLGAQLVERDRRQIRLTSLGETFAGRAQQILRSVDELADLARASNPSLSGRLRIGMIPTVAPYLLPAVIRRLTERFPAVDLRPREAVTGKLTEDLISGGLDIAVMALPASEPSLQDHPLFDEEFVLVRPVADRHKPAPGIDSLRQMRLLLLEEGHCFRDQALAFCNMTSGLAQDPMEGSSLATLVRMVGAGMGVTLIPEMAIAAETSAVEVSIARLAEPRPARRIGLVWRRTNPLAQHFTEVGDIVREEHAMLRRHDGAVRPPQPGKQA
ncbi:MULTISPECIES: hydrogen peroxide-inducible genes activator [Bosea]|uniref:hydrogen peroxide-inducible genes activator n=1 Tax=Bosea TaxID=85413 RepID=UPI00214FA54E|nr:MULTISPECIES: hydrogen peroxide-inducible genes activator [Bosea]MCR4524488.1 LysR substrate-binding domain-containing protein [Bosea sp. 47.2.35]MDR6831456.1 LysR family hydrogen peroxide-inducible transcriptional activator [Bosea robiniae]MDR6898195.1 LysR family hydrogen peroxide-inducible transcriptional activator [Bosea sp. BE109]MDR7141582.1 LysR family hydrogen peroxide-inducible transcriptional activator [Bosea sp. BE168]MDR7178205.1 LysR family hydrogen peroxide-inducible transcrip